MKKIIIFITFLALNYNLVNANNDLDITNSGSLSNSGSTQVDYGVEKISTTYSDIYKYAILSRAYIRYNSNNGEEILNTLEVYYKDLRRTRNIEKLYELKEKTQTILIELNKIENLSKDGELILNLVKHMYYRSLLELALIGEINL